MSRSEQQPRKIDARGIYSPHGRTAVDVKEPGDLVRAGIQISYEAAAATWGEEKARQFIKPGTIGPKKVDPQNVVVEETWWEPLTVRLGVSIPSDRFHL